MRRRKARWRSASCLGLNSGFSTGELFGASFAVKQLLTRVVPSAAAPPVRHSRRLIGLQGIKRATVVVPFDKSASQQPAVNVQYGGGDIVRHLRSQKDNRLGDILGLADAGDG